MIVSNDDQLIKKARFLSTQAREPARHYEHKVVGYNYRLSNVLAGIGRGQLKVLDKRVHSRRDIFDRYVQGLSDLDIINWMPEPAWSYSNRWLTAGTVNQDFDISGSLNLQNYLVSELIEVRPVWKPMHLQPLYINAPYYEHETGYSVSESLYAQGICLPSGSNMSLSQQDRVIDAIRKFAKNNK
jgi:pyridoxal phosphate-dependent aminotransferase EpsN